MGIHRVTSRYVSEEILFRSASTADVLQGLATHGFTRTETHIVHHIDFSGSRDRFFAKEQYFSLRRSWL